MDQKKNKLVILVSGASGIVGYGILKCLRELKNYYLIGTTIYPFSPAECFSDQTIIVPNSIEENYIETLISIVKKYKVDMLIPGIELDMQIWNENRDTLEKTGVFLLLNNSSLISLCLDKYLFYAELKKRGVSCLIDSSIEKDYEIFQTPFVLKPRRGTGKKGFKIIKDKKTFLQYRDKIGDELLMQEYVGDDNEEYTVGCFFDKESKMKAIISMRRTLSKEGYTEKAEIVEPAELKFLIMELGNILKPIGPTNFQFRKSVKGWKLLEINPRLSSSASIRAKFGYNEAQMAINYFLLNKNIQQPVVKKGYAIRYIEDFIIYDDIVTHQISDLRRLNLNV